jgi:hypothetical protein
MRFRFIRISRHDDELTKTERGESARNTTVAACAAQVQQIGTRLRQDESIGAATS